MTDPSPTVRLTAAEIEEIERAGEALAKAEAATEVDIADGEQS